MTIKEARERAGLTVEEAAKKIGIAKGMILDWEKEKKVPSPTMFVTACAAYNVSPKDVIIIGKNDQEPLTLSGARYSAGYSVEAAATKVGISYGTLRNMEYGACLISDEQKKKLCELYGIAPEDIRWPRDKEQAPKKIELEPVPEPESPAEPEWNPGAPEMTELEAVPKPGSSAKLKWNPGAPEMTEQDRMFLDLACAQDMVEQAKQQISAYDEYIAEMEEKARAKDDVLRAALEVNAERLQEINSLQVTIDVMQQDINRLNHRMIELKAELYDVYKENEIF